MSNQPSSTTQDPLDALLSSYQTATASSSSTNNDGSIGPVKKKEYGYKDFEALLESTPIFMKETPKDGETNDVLEALRTLVFEGEGDEVATNFKNHGNELHLQKSYSEAIKAYTSGIESNPKDLKLKITLLNNRAQCNLLLKNHRSVLKDTATIIALYNSQPNLEKDKPLIKSMYRATNSLIALERWKESLDVIQRAKKELKENQDSIKGEDLSLWDNLQEKVENGIKKDEDRIKRIQREKFINLTLNKAINQRGLIQLKTNSPPDNPNQLHFDPTEYDDTTLNEETPLIFPVFLLYPQYNQSDFITHFQENTSFQDQLLQMFPSNNKNSIEIPWAEWDQNKQYHTDNLVIYVETEQKRLLKVGKELTLREIIKKAKRDEKPEDNIKKDGIVLRDGLLSFIVLPRGDIEKQWIETYKWSRDGK
ncbi:uncharacterized protein L201_002632 [Kwoniella dendrophila CBS 6074]|uniref:Cns1/TTC4 wheel domain-containing protein n=1 Tax=Kwoniella dendrophila CBS 6074 TaxID=1295534 RepID=A0AAX4JT82_9TREE